MKPPEAIIIACAPVEDGPPRQPSGDGKCTGCDAKVWVSNAVVESMQKLGNVKTVIVCHDCIGIVMPAPPVSFEDLACPSPYKD
jgi:hypothetical protein